MFVYGQDEQSTSDENCIEELVTAKVKEALAGEPGETFCCFCCTLSGLFAFICCGHNFPKETRLEKNEHAIILRFHSLMCSLSYSK